MPNEAQLKAQMQAAIAAKKKATSHADSPTSPSMPSNEEVTKKESEPIEPKDSPPIPTTIPNPSNDRRPPVVDENPIALTFFGQNIRITTYKGNVYFAMDDILPLSNTHEYQTRYIEFKNQPSSRARAEELIKTLTFTGENGVEKLDGAKAENVIIVLRELKLSSPGPLSRWLEEISHQYQPQKEDSVKE